MKKKAIVLLLVLSLVIGTFTGLSFMSASTALAGSESTFVTEEFMSNDYITYTNGVPKITLSGSAVTICNTYDQTNFSSVLKDSAEVLPDGSSKYVQNPVTTAWSKYIRMRSHAIALTEACQVVVSAYVRFPEMASGTTADVLIGFATAAATNVVDGETTAVGNTWTKVTAVVSLAAGNTYFQLQTPTSSTGYTYAFDVCGISVKKVESKQIVNGDGNELITDGNAPAVAGDTVFFGSQKIAHFKTAGSTSQFNLGQDSVAGTDVDGNGRYFAVAKIELTNSEASNADFRNKLPFFVQNVAFTAGAKYIVSAYVKLPAAGESVTATLATTNSTSQLHLADPSKVVNKSADVTLTTQWQQITLVFTASADDKQFGLALSTPAAIDVDAISIQKVGTKTVTNYGSELVSNGTVINGYTTKVGTGNNILSNYVDNTGGKSLKDRGYTVTGSDNDGSNAYYAIPQGTNSEAHRNKVVFYASLLADTANFAAGKTYTFTCVARLPEGSTATDINMFWGASLYAAHIANTDHSESGFTLQPVTLTNEWQTVTATITIPEGAAKSQFFGLGINTPTAVDVDSISIKEVTGTQTELDITEVSTVVPFEVKTEGNGIATIVGFGQRGKIYYGMETTVVAIPNASEFLGWYVGKTCVSTDLEYTFIASEDGINANEITAKFAAAIATPGPIYGTNVAYNATGANTKDAAAFGAGITACFLQGTTEKKSANISGIRATGAGQDGDGYYAKPDTSLHWSASGDAWRNLVVFYNGQFGTTTEVGSKYYVSAYVRLQAAATDVKAYFATANASGRLHVSDRSQKGEEFALSTEWTKVEWVVENKDAAKDVFIGLVLTKAASVDFDNISIKECLTANRVTIDLMGSYDEETSELIQIVSDSDTSVCYYEDGLAANVLTDTDFAVSIEGDTYRIEKVYYAEQKFGDNLAKDGVATVHAYGTETRLVVVLVEAGDEPIYATLQYQVDKERPYAFAKVSVDDLADALNNLPALYGKTPAGTYVIGAEEYTAAELLQQSFAQDVIITVNYNDNVSEETKPTVSVEGENVSVSAQDGSDATGKVAPYTIVTFTATGEDFSYWVIKGTDTVVSSKAIYTCYVVDDVELEAVYGVADAPKAVVTVKAVDTTDGLVIVADRSTSEGIITTYGVIISEREESGDIFVTDKGTYEDGRVIVSERNNGSTPNGTYVVTKGLKDADGNNYENGKTLYFRAYVIVDGAPVYSATTSETITVTQ